MEGSLIDFDSPKHDKGETLVPKSLSGVPAMPLGQSSTNCCSIAAGENNPFDLVVSQVASNTADQNDPFEMVLNDVLSCLEGKIKSIDVSSKVVHQILDDASTTFGQESKFSVQETSSRIDFDNSTENTSQEIMRVETHRDDDHHSKCKITSALEDMKSEEWTCLDDIPPPDSLLSSSADMSNLLDDTLSTSILSLSVGKENVLSDELEMTDACKRSANLRSYCRSVHPVASPKSEEDLKIQTQKKIENLISRAEFEVKLDIQDSAIKKRLSIQNIAAPSTPRSVREVLWKSEEQSRNLQRWSQEESKKFNFKSNMIPSDSCPITLAHKRESMICNDDWMSASRESRAGSLEMPWDASPLSPLIPQLTLPREKSSNSLHLLSGEEDFIAVNECLLQGGSDALQLQPPTVRPQDNSTENFILVGQSMRSSLTSSSPVLLPLPLCEDAVRNLSLCSKYSPGKDTLQYRSTSRSGDHQNKSITQKQESAQAKLVLRKPTELPKAHQKMAPMKATAPVQNMTRSRSSLTTHVKSGQNSSYSLNKKCLPKASCPRMPVAGCLRKPGSMTPTLGGSLPNLTSQGSKLPTKLPSPRRSSGSPQKPIALRKQSENWNNRNVPSHLGSSPSVCSSPRPLHKVSSTGRSASLSRVLTDINASPIARKSMKCRNIQVEVTKRGSIITDKENFL